MNLRFVSVLSLCLVLISSLWSPVSVYAQTTTPAPQIVNLGIKVSSTLNNQIAGSVNIDNESGRSLENVYLLIQLIAPGTQSKISVNGQVAQVTSEGQMVAFTRSENFSAALHQPVAKDFEFQYPATINSGSYILTAQILDKSFGSLGITNQNIALEGLGKFLTIDDTTCKIKSGGSTYPGNSGTNIKSGETATAVCEVKNPTQTAVSVRPQFNYTEYSVSKNPAEAQNVATPELKEIPAGQILPISVTLPTGLAPYVYEGLMQMTDVSGQVVSAKIPFRWVIEGPSARIQNINLDKTYYQKDETAKVAVYVSPSADLSWRGVPDGNLPYTQYAGTDLANAKVDIKITDKDKNLCGEKTENLPSTNNLKNWNGMNVDVLMTRDCQDPTVEATVLGDDGKEVLASLSKTIPSSDEDMKSPLKAAASNWPAIIGLVVVILIAAGIFIFIRRRRNPPGSDITGRVGTPPAPDASSAAAKITVFLLLALSVYLFFGKVTFPKHLFNFNWNVEAQQAVVKQPVNSTDAEATHTVEIFAQDKGKWIWGNVRDFAQNTNNPGGDSSVIVSPDCTHIDVIMNGSGGASNMCSNDGAGLTIGSFIDDQPVEQLNSRSPIGNWFFTPSNIITPTDFTILGFGGVGQRSGAFSINIPPQYRIGTHTLSVRTAATYVHSGDWSVTYTTYNRPSCRGSGPCYIESKYQFACKPPPACNETCATDVECSQNVNGCTQCRPGANGANTCQPPPACNEKCASDQECSKNTAGCTQCRPDAASGQTTCQKPPACNETCTTTQECLTNKQGCVECRPDTTGKMACQPPPLACNAACSTDKDCFGNKSGCNLCLEGVCQPPASCNTACTSDKTCETAKDGCVACVSGTCRIPPSCGTACTTKADCSGAKDNCSECLEGTCTDFNDNMCKCDGIVADIQYPSTSFNFEAFGKVEGANVAKAEIADVTFRMTKDNQVIAKSSPITPTVVENSANKLRVKAAWSTPPPPVAKNAIYQVFADVRCKPKRITSVTDASMNQTTQSLTGVFDPKPPVALSWLRNLIDQIAKSENWKGRSLVGKVMAQLASPSPQADSNLQLRTLNFVKMLETDNCKTIMFKFDETLF